MFVFGFASLQAVLLSHDSSSFAVHSCRPRYGKSGRLWQLTAPRSSPSERTDSHRRVRPLNYVQSIACTNILTANSADYEEVDDGNSVQREGNPGQRSEIQKGQSHLVNNIPMVSPYSWTRSMTALEASNSSVVNDTGRESTPTMLSCLPHLYQMTRPANFVGVILFHMMGTYLAARKSPAPISAHSSYYWSLLLGQPLMWVTLIELFLVASTSMVINDYFDYKLGLDSNRNHNRLVSGQVTLVVAEHFVSCLYAAALVLVAFVPGIVARLSVLMGLMVTFLYTKHLKPITWIKNVVCASLIAVSPLVSGSAALHLLNRPHAASSQIFKIGPLWCVVGMLFFHFMAREIMMDCNDVADDQSHGVNTVAVKYGRRFASRIALMFSILAALCAMAPPISDLVTLWGSVAVPLHTPSKTVLGRRMLLASLGSLARVRRAWQVYQSQGESKDVLDRAIGESQKTSLVLWASCV